MNFKMVFSDLHCRYSRPIGGYGFNQVGGQESQRSVFISSL